MYFSCFAWQAIVNAVIKYQRTYRYASIGLADAILRPKTLDNRLAISTQILIAMDYYFFFLIYFREVLPT